MLLEAAHVKRHLLCGVTSDASSGGVFLVPRQTRAFFYKLKRGTMPFEQIMRNAGNTHLVPDGYRLLLQEGNKPRAG